MNSKMPHASRNFANIRLTRFISAEERPSDLSPNDTERILKQLHSSYNLANDCEITMEGRIAGFRDDTVKACLDNGVNRFSIGVQTFNTKLRKMVGRTSEQKEVIDFLNKLTSFNQASVVIDLLYGLPGQTMDDWVEDQRIVLEETAISGTWITTN